MYLGAVAELLQSMSTDIKEKVVMSVLQHGNTAGPQPVVAGSSMMMQRCRPDRLLNVQQSQLQAIAAIAGHSGTASAPLQPGAAAGLPYLMQDPAEVMQLPEFISVSEANVGKFARALVLRSVFGEKVLRQSTIKGDNKRGLRMLNRTKLDELFALIHHHPSFVHYIGRLQHLYKEGTKVLTLGTVSVYTSPVFSRFHRLPTSVGSVTHA